MDAQAADAEVKRRTRSPLRRAYTLGSWSMWGLLVGFMFGVRACVGPHAFDRTSTPRWLDIAIAVVATVVWVWTTWKEPRE